MQRTWPCHFPMPRDLRSWSALPTLFLTQQTYSFSCHVTLKSVRMVLGMSRWSSPCTLTLKDRALDWLGCGTSWLALSEIISMLLFVKVSPEMDQRQTSTHVGRNHLSWDILPFDVLICLPSPLRSFWSRYLGVWSGFVFLLKYTSLDVSYHWGNIFTSHFTNDNLLAHRLYFSPPSLIILGENSSFMMRCLVMESSSVPRKDPRNQENTE